MGSDLMTIGIEILHLAVVSPFMRYIECSRDRASIWIITTLFEQISIQSLVQVIHRVIEGQQHNLWYLLGQVVA